ncbi:MAG: flagellar biosynthesis anti-sigma factor FlgM [Peptococcaceae bacterium]|nr:flagellar biosynthesis anti-sigma factor FlgM [Peptococcaceae bacterium]
MKIDGVNVNMVNLMTNPKSAEVSAAEKTKHVSKLDNVEVSGQAQLMQKVLQKTKEIPDIREERVQEIAAKIESGNFIIDSQLIARKMLGE